MVLQLMLTVFLGWVCCNGYKNYSHCCVYLHSWTYVVWQCRQGVLFDVLSRTVLSLHLPAARLSLKPAIHECTMSND